MQATAIETLRIASNPNVLWVHVETDQGLVGLGETLYGSESAEAHVHQVIAPYLLGRDPTNVEAHQAHLTGYLGFVGSSAEVRARSAVDIALWDLLGQRTGLPLCDLLGGRVRERIRVYNTCAGYRYVQTKPVQGTANFGLDAPAAGPYEDLKGFLERADEVAESLLAMGIDGMKIWPFDFAAEATQGQAISTADLKRGLEPFEKIREAVGDRIDVMAELHSMWNRPAAIEICRALEPLKPRWVEDPVFLDHLDSVGVVARATRCPIAVGETRGTRADFRMLLEQDALAMAIMDIAWCGGISEAHRIAAMAETFHTPVAFHDCSGPVVLTASAHLALHTRNCHLQEIVRAFCFGWYGDVVTALPPIANGTIGVPDGPGLGIALQPDLRDRPGTRTRRTTLADVR
jgi:L-alanine-DL-glutamate epimerase-like enolase superfamily enzyme